MEKRHSSAPPPNTDTDTLDWDPSAAGTVCVVDHSQFDPANLPTTKREPKPWERVPCKPGPDSRFRIVWKSYEFISRTTAVLPPLFSRPIRDDSILALGRPLSPERAIKRRRLATGTIDVEKSHDCVSLLDKRPVYLETKWDIRTAYLRHKNIATDSPKFSRDKTNHTNEDTDGVEMSIPQTDDLINFDDDALSCSSTHFEPKRSPELVDISLSREKSDDSLMNDDPKHQHNGQISNILSREMTIPDIAKISSQIKGLSQTDTSQSQTVQNDKSEDATSTPLSNNITFTTESGDLIEFSIHESNKDHQTEANAEMKHQQIPFPKTSSPQSPMSQYLPPVQVDPPSPTVEDVTATITISSLAQLEDDKAILRSFLDRAAASKGVKASMNILDTTACAKRESIQNKRDSGAIRQALASPRPALNDKDGNVSFSVAAEDTVQPKVTSVSLNASDLDLLIPPIDDLLQEQADAPLITNNTSKGSPKTGSPRRSSRSKSRKIVAPLSSVSVAVNSQLDRKQISVRRNDGNETVNLTKTQAQLLAIETRKNTRKNKGSAESVRDRLVKWEADTTVFGVEHESKPIRSPQAKKKIVVWSDTLEFLNEATGMSERAPLLDNAQQPSKPINVIILPDAERGSTQSVEPKSRKANKASTPKTKRTRSLRSSIGVPAKNLLSDTIMADEITETLDLQQSIPASKPASTLANSQSKSRLQQPANLSLNASVNSASITINEKEKENVKKVAQPKASGIPIKSSSLPVANSSKRNGRKIP